MIALSFLAVVALFALIFGLAVYATSDKRPTVDETHLQPRWWWTP